jgi:hypothetical protein
LKPQSKSDLSGEVLKSNISKTQTTYHQTHVLLVLLLIMGLTSLISCAEKGDNSEPTSVVRLLLEAKENNDVEAYNKAFFYEPDDLLNQNDGDLGVISLTINRLEISESKMKWFVETYTNSDLAKKRSWTNDFIKNIVAVVAEYSVDYDNTKVPFQDGDISQTFYVVRKNVSSPWLILEADSPHQSEEGLFR